MPPKKSTQAKGARGKAKAQDKEEKKQAKIAKSQAKGKHTDTESHSLSHITVHYCEYWDSLYSKWEHWMNEEWERDLII